jgi:hypothetical protein
MYVEAGESLIVAITFSAPLTADTDLRASISGYLVDVP